MSDISMSHASSWLYMKIPIKARLLGYVDAQISGTSGLNSTVRKLVVSKSTVLERMRPIMGDGYSWRLQRTDLEWDVNKADAIIFATNKKASSPDAFLL